MIDCEGGGGSASWARPPLPSWCLSAAEPAGGFQGTGQRYATQPALLRKRVSASSQRFVGTVSSCGATTLAQTGTNCAKMHCVGVFVATVPDALDVVCLLDMVTG